MFLTHPPLLSPKIKDGKAAWLKMNLTVVNFAPQVQQTFVGFFLKINQQ